MTSQLKLVNRFRMDEETIHETKYFEIYGTRHRAHLVVPREPVACLVVTHESAGGNDSTLEEFHDRGFVTLLLDPADRGSGSAAYSVRNGDLTVMVINRAREYLASDPRIFGLKVGFMGFGNGADAVLVAAGRYPHLVSAVVAQACRPKSAGTWLGKVQAPILFVVGGMDVDGLSMNRRPERLVNCISALRVIPFAGRDFLEPGALKKVHEYSADWFELHLAGGNDGKH